MKELSLNILDVANNSLKAGATKVDIHLIEEGNVLKLVINDNGCGMSEETLENVTNPFYTTRTTRKVGLGLPFLKEAAEVTGGKMEITSVQKEVSPKDCGTCVSAYFNTDSIDFTPIGDIVSTIVTLVQGAPQVDFEFVHSTKNGTVSLDTRDIRQVLGDDIPLSSPEVLSFIKESLETEYNSI